MKMSCGSHESKHKTLGVAAAVHLFETATEGEDDDGGRVDVLREQQQPREV